MERNRYDNQENSTKFFSPQTPQYEEEEYDDDEYEDEEEYDDEDDDEEEEETRSMFVPILSAVTIVVIIAAVFFVVSLLSVKLPQSNTSRETFIVPDLIGMTFSEAQERYQDYTITIDGSPMPSDLEPDMIFSQYPPAGTTANIGTELKIKISSGVERIELPNLVGSDYNSAISILEIKNLRVVTKFDLNNDYNRSLVYEMSPKAGTVVDPGTEITLYVSLGFDQLPVKVPKFVGLLIDDARQSAFYLNLTLEVATQLAHSSEPAGTIVSQSVPEGQEVLEGSIINVSISDGVAPKNEVSVDFYIPNGYVGNYQIDIYLDGEVLKSSGAINAKIAAVAKIPLSGSGIKDVTLVLTNLASTRTATFGTMTINFTENAIISNTMDLEGAFAMIGEIDPDLPVITAPPPTTATTAATVPTTAETQPTAPPETTAETQPTDTEPTSPPDTEPAIPANNE